VDRPELARRFEGIFRQTRLRVWRCRFSPAGRCRKTYRIRSTEAISQIGNALRVPRDRRTRVVCRTLPNVSSASGFPGCDHERGQPEDRVLSHVREP
jgi:hypothetical protein